MDWRRWIKRWGKQFWNVSVPLTRTIRLTNMADHKQSALAPKEAKDTDDVVIGESQVYIDPKKESRLLLKFDVRCSGAHSFITCLLTGNVSSSMLLDFSAFST